MDHYHEFATFYRQARPEVVRAVGLTVASTDLAQDAVDEAFVRAAERWDRVRGMSNREGWVYRVAVNWAVDRRRWKVRRPTAATERFDAPQHDQIADHDVRGRLLALPLDQRTAVVLRYFLDLSVEQTAQILGVAAGTVKARTTRALTALRRAEPDTAQGRRVELR